MPRLLVTGSRSFADMDLALTALSEARWTLGPAFTVVHGGAKGADEILATLAAQRGLVVEKHDADWSAPCRTSCRPGHRKTRRDGSTYCPAAGNYRNQAMIEAGADLCIALLVAGLRCDGTRDCGRRATAAGIPVRWYTQETR